MAYGLQKNHNPSLRLNYGDKLRTYYENGNTRTSGLILPNGHGDATDTNATPLGSGIAVLVGLGAAYALKKRKKE